jgi:hypothetical protein
MDLQALCQRTGISKRRLRYCLDHNLVPGLVNVARDERGRPRRFAEDVGFAIVCAAVLLDLGLPHGRIRAFMEGMLQIKWKDSQDLVLLAVLERPFAAFAELGDGINVRIVVADPDNRSPWVAPGNPAPLAADYEPSVVVRLNIGKIRDQVFGSAKRP